MIGSFDETENRVRQARHVELRLRNAAAATRSGSEAKRAVPAKSLVHESSTIIYDLSATINAFKSWIAWRARLRFKVQCDTQVFNQICNCLSCAFLFVFWQHAVKT
jgi:hypothetical protein